jgi:hypothetical protein
MMIYIKLWRVGAAHLEFSYEFSAWPFFEATKTEQTHEMILDVPFIRLILTPWRRTKSSVPIKIDLHDDDNKKAKAPCGQQIQYHKTSKCLFTTGH